MQNRIIAIVEKDLGLPEASILSQMSLHKVCVGRYMVYRYLHEEHGWSANRLARLFNRTRKNIFRGIMILRNQMEFDPQLLRQYTTITEKIEGETIASPSKDMEE